MSVVAKQTPVLTGAAAAAQLGLDGFANLSWPNIWCGPVTLRCRHNLIRTRSPIQPYEVGGLTTAHPALVLRHLGYQAEAFDGLDGMTARDRIESAVEHALRKGLVTVDQLYSPKSRVLGDRLLLEILQLRGDEPPAESHAEVRAIQFLRDWGYGCWRQMHIYERGRIVHRADLVVPFHPRARRPEILSPSDGLLVEVDGRSFHEREFEKDHARQTTYDLLGWSWTAFTPTQFETQTQRVRRAFETVFLSARRRQAVAPDSTQTRFRSTQTSKTRPISRS